MENTNTPAPIFRPWRIFLLVVMTILICGGLYFGAVKFFKDRQRTMSFDDRLYRRQFHQKNFIPSRTERTYTKEEMEEARKKGKLPQELRQPYMPPVNNSGEAAVQRSLRTIQEINKINEMNQRLMDQQRRMQNQK